MSSAFFHSTEITNSPKTNGPREGKVDVFVAVMNSTRGNTSAAGHSEKSPVYSPHTLFNLTYITGDHHPASLLPQH